MLTNAMHARIKSLSNGGTWKGVGGTSRPRSDVRSGLRAWMLAAQGGKCAFGEAGCIGQGGQDWTPEFLHINVRGFYADGSTRTSQDGLGWTAGNIAVGCRPCNVAHQRYGAHVPYAAITFPERVMVEWPSRGFLVDLTRQVRVGA